ncbi:cytochrome C [Rhodobacteraceae bacterium]|nr:cytochrome C [Paracoccaceae bacterium]
MKKLLNTTFGLCLLSAPVLADGHATGDAVAGEAVFNQCKACHSIVDADDNVILRGGKNGPNLYGVYTRVAGTVDGFRYGDSLVEAGEAGLAWKEADFVAYVEDPRKFLRTYNDDSRARSNMSFKLRAEEDRLNVWAYLVSVGPEVKATN